jgi:hypothetical protein
MNLKEILIQQSFKDEKFSHNMFRSKSNESLRYLCKEKTQFLHSDSPDAQRAWHIYHELYQYPLCSAGNERRTFHSFEKGYIKTCHLPRFQCSCWDTARESSSKTMTKTNEEGKIKRVLLSRYGVETPSRIPGVGDKISLSQQNLLFGRMESAGLTLEKLKCLRSLDWWKSRCNKSVNELAVELGIANSSIKYFGDRLDTYHTLKTKRLSKPEIKIRDLLLEIGVVFKRNDREQIQPLELDFYIPSHSLAIEINGIYHHSELAGGKGRNYHIRKDRNVR